MTNRWIETEFAQNLINTGQDHALAIDYQQYLDNFTDDDVEGSYYDARTNTYTPLTWNDWLEDVIEGEKWLKANKHIWM